MFMLTRVIFHGPPMLRNSSSDLYIFIELLKAVMSKKHFELKNI